MKPKKSESSTPTSSAVFQNPNLQVKARPRKEDLAELYVGDEVSAWSSRTKTTATTISRWQSSTSTSEPGRIGLLSQLPVFEHRRRLLGR